MINRIFVSVLLIAITITLIGSVNARATRPLTDTEMSSLFGGCGGIDCDVTGLDCAPLYLDGDCSGSSDPRVPDPWPGGSGGCDGSWKTSCKQAKKECFIGECEEGCTPGTEECQGTYAFYTCGMQNNQCEVERAEPDFECKGRSGYENKPWCGE